ncbi:hypothetical protein CKM354_000148800 [Cercospora kikuchii]|uniref:FAD-binding domain-containing protein n=1 Tax=Cercospora kikuchii TaxID=84275 RepID=A0A9P3CB09_9PEZI|nr:uncharacterized protein CKM354_000148800 [Cercospora kikuchii]GIZ38062.1 hypothetical protein CKM354_000148800 [Cercospora kikuchii]
MKVIIVGGGIAGLTFANALSQAEDIEFILLEARSLLDPQVGASIGLGAQSLRIFDQFGAAQAILDETVPLTYARGHYPDGRLISEPQPIFRLLEPRLGYGLSFLDRQLVLRAAADTLEAKIAETGRGEILLNKRLAKVEHYDTGVKVFCEDGTFYEGDVVVGCDGVNSRVRNEMWRNADVQDPGAFSKEEKEKMTAEYMCLFGISTHVPGVEDPGCADLTYDKGRGFLVITGKEKRCFWFYFEKMDKVHRYTDPGFPRFTKEDAERVAKANLGRMVKENVSLGDLWERRVSFTLVPMEEALFEKWSWGRMATIGDCAHKMTANHGQAGNNAIESAAALANQLVALSKKTKEFKTVDFTNALRAWQAKRQARIEATVKEAALVCRYNCLETPMAYVFNYYLVPSLPSLIVDMQAGNMVGAELLEYLPVPKRSLKGSMPFNQNQGTGKSENVIWRSLRAAPLLLIGWWMWSVRKDMGGKWDEEWDGWLKVVADPIGADSERIVRVVTFLVQEIMFFALRNLESGRRTNRLNVFLRFPIWVVIFGHIYGAGVTIPIYFFFHYLTGRVDAFAAGDMRMMNTAYIKTILPSLLLVEANTLAPILLQTSTNLDLGTLKVLRHLAPLPISLFQLALTRLNKDTEEQDMIRNYTADLPKIRRTIYGMLSLGGLVLAYQAFNFTPASPADSTKVFFGLVSIPSNFDVLHYTHGALTNASIYWLGLLFYDLCYAGMCSIPKTILSFLGFLVLHLAAPFQFRPLIDVSFVLVAWLVREEILATKKERHAITKEKYGAGKSVWEVEGKTTSIKKTGNETLVNGKHGESTGIVEEVLNGHLKHSNGVPKGLGLGDEGAGPRF